ncbi:CDP-alcohol phosphatidyltransferase family protein [Nostoc sp. 'Peltigera membranacea cyanobiont' 232]|uniref:CDP-alcohol phosphatidyltransferase family protein n=1 Tax=Nostoc sp. 'Peltigera membranacea cyanobiont' 232 TaxID=2014531 RepID=UPI000B959253|nr:CDP-alcohol phosphatidyltransferase family protein [Nostoc sp. 'Peltigera membranacea cyanobiont' 232]OYE00249.1 CDP-diacylglycerol--glycerol-3-phosphate 3-phosphatidyltransferase [Nostoc sp. 'Peltigera membranacea cyanobiont' 232]
MIKLSHLPITLVGMRFALAPLLVLDALDHRTSFWFIIGYVIAVLSDIFDGIIARRLKVSTALLRQADSWADICLYLCVAISIWLVYPQVIINFRVPLLSAITIQLILFTISLIKFQKFPSFHTYTAKAWGLALLTATVGLFGFGYANILWFAIALCWLNSLEEIAMTLLLPTWQCDILSIFHAVELRKTLMRSPTSQDGV